MFVADAVAMSRQPQGGHALHETGGQAAEAAVAQRRVRLHLSDALQRHPQLGHGLACHVEQAEVAQVVDQQAADEKFQRQVIDPLAVLARDLSTGFFPVIDQVVAGGQGQGLEPVVVEGIGRILAHGITQFGQDRRLEAGNHAFVSYL